MKCTSLVLSLCLLCIPAFPAAAADAPKTDNFHFSSASVFSVRSAYSAAGATSASSAAFFYNDGNGQPTVFDMHRVNNRMTITIRQHNATLWRRTLETDSNSFSVTRHTEDGHTFFLITAGDTTLKVQADSQGIWRAEPIPASQDKPNQS